jgi:multidrug efflux system outer membrane protein
MSKSRLKRSIAFLVFGMWTFQSTGCLVGPNYHPPQAKVPGQWAGTPAAPVSGTTVTVPEATGVVEWWQNFKDPVLDSLINQAVQANLNLQQAEARILEARAARTVTASGLWPTVDASGSVSRTRSPGSSGGSAQPSEPKARNLFQAGLDAAWELDLFGGVRRSIEAADANIQAAVEDRRDVLVTLTAEVAATYILLRGLQQQIAITRKNLETQRGTAEVTRKRFQVGFVSRLDVANAEAQVATTLSLIPPLETSARQAIYSLSVLLGREPAALLSELSPEKAIPATPPVVPVGLPSDLLRRRPDIRRVEAQVHSATAQIGVATADLYPKFSLTGTLGAQATGSGSLGNANGGFWSLGTGVLWPVFNAGRIRANIRLQDAIQQEVLLAYQQTVLTALQDVENALVAYEKEQQHRTALADAVASNQTAVDLSMRLYIQGETDFLNVLSAQRNLFVTQDALAQSEATVAVDLVALFKALGGGWEPFPEARPGLQAPPAPPSPTK